MKKGIVLEGGAKRGIYTAGVLDVLLENNILADGVIGVSAGAIHGCSYVSKQQGRSIRYNMKYGNDYRFMSFRSLLKTGNIVDTEFCYHELPEKLDVFDNNTFKKSKIKFYVTCSNILTGTPEYILCQDMFKDIDYLRASASLPFVSQIVKVNNQELLDGGITDSIPLQAFQNMGYQKNLVILTRTNEYYKKPSIVGRLLAPFVYNKYPNFVRAIKDRHIMYNQELDYIKKEERSNPNTLVLRPSRKVRISKMESNLNIVQEMYELGRSDAIANLDKIKSFFA